MPEVKKNPYRLLPGKFHRVPNPDFREGKDEPEASHVVASGDNNDTVWLTDEQYKSFKDKFRPISSDGSELRDQDAADLEAAKLKTLKTGEPTNPNEKTPAIISPGASTTAGAVPTPNKSS